MIRLRMLLLGGVIAVCGGAVVWAQPVPAAATVPASPPPPAVPVPAPVKLPSMMFTADQVTDINRALDRAPAVAAPTEAAGGAVVAKPAVQSLALSALLYTDAAHWTVWVNGERLGPGIQSDGYRVVAVSRDMVEFEIDGPPVQRVRLKPHETFDVGMGPGDNGSIQ
ncbi:MAG TPA: hypothetical protein VK558_00450 [Patescibacteria group bacterium]|nr:hypothetical protein [Patescibacteria group bacterium]